MGTEEEVKRTLRFFNNVVADARLTKKMHAFRVILVNAKRSNGGSLDVEISRAVHTRGS